MKKLKWYTLKLGIFKISIVILGWKKFNFKFEVSWGWE